MVPKQIQNKLHDACPRLLIEDRHRFVSGSLRGSEKMTSLTNRTVAGDHRLISTGLAKLQRLQSETPTWRAILSAGDRSSTDTRCPHKSGSHERHAGDEKRRFQPRQFPIATHGCASVVDPLGAGRLRSINERLRMPSAPPKAAFGRQLGSGCKQSPPPGFPAEADATMLGGGKLGS